jgi:fibro-slime domain-containing protein
MTLRARALAPVSLLATCIVAACSSSNPQASSGDAGVDASTGADSAAGSDATSGVDAEAGGSSDAPTAGDVGALPDAADGSAVDATDGAVADAATDANDAAKGPLCGDGVLQAPEQCDDGNLVSGDGCSASCTIEPFYVCPTPDKPCTSTVVCGDGKVQGSETCDDGNAMSGDGCSSTCQVEPGWQCPTADTACIGKKCGDGIVAGREACDDGNVVSGDGCSATCQLEPGFACANQGTPPESTCHKTTCGDGIKEGFEACDDGNRIPFDGCSATCTLEPRCAGGTCTAVCGDGLLVPQESCDDGNLVSGDGCSSTCTVEPGWTCSAVDQTPGATLTLPILYRDMLYASTPAPLPAMPDFENPCCGVVTGLVSSTLGADGEPVWQSNTGSGATNFLSGAVNFCWWYHQGGCAGAGSTNPYDKLVYLDATGNPTALSLPQAGLGGVYQFSSVAFYPIDNLGWNDPANAQAGLPQTGTDCGGTTGHNFSFTSETHYAFTYHASTSPTATFTGDDDVWMFVNGHLAVDLGGVHGATTGTVTLDAAHATMFGLTDGGAYTIDLFQAERHTCGSDYTLSFSAFTHRESQCATKCGDGIVAGSEVCDDGTNMGTYGGCAAGCGALGPYCDDAILQNPPEVCDDGTNQSTYGGTSKQCGPGCQWAFYCGDGIVSNGEQCDGGPNCRADCTLISPAP